VEYDFSVPPLETNVLPKGMIHGGKKTHEKQIVGKKPQHY
jgi:hypothetical protein